jgi:hypothetical protein
MISRHIPERSLDGQCYFDAYCVTLPRKKHLIMVTLLLFPAKTVNGPFATLCFRISVLIHFSENVKIAVNLYISEKG